MLSGMLGWTVQLFGVFRLMLRCVASGMMAVAVAPVSSSVATVDTYFVVGHFHMVLAIAVVSLMPPLWMEFAQHCILSMKFSKILPRTVQLWWRPCCCPR